MLRLLRRQGRGQRVAVLQASVKPNKQAQLGWTHSSTSSGPLVEDRGLVAGYQVSLCHAARQDSGLQCAGSFMVQVDVTQATLVRVGPQVWFGLFECSKIGDLRLPVEDLFRTCPRIGKVCD